MICVGLQEKTGKVGGGRTTKALLKAGKNNRIDDVFSCSRGGLDDWLTRLEESHGSRTSDKRHDLLPNLDNGTSTHEWAGRRSPSGRRRGRHNSSTSSNGVGSIDDRGNRQGGDRRTRGHHLSHDILALSGARRLACTLSSSSRGRGGLADGLGFGDGSGGALAGDDLDGDLVALLALLLVVDVVEGAREAVPEDGFALQGELGGVWADLPAVDVEGACLGRAVELELVV